MVIHGIRVRNQPRGMRQNAHALRRIKGGQGLQSIGRGGKSPLVERRLPHVNRLRGIGKYVVQHIFIVNQPLRPFDNQLIIFRRLDGLHFLDLHKLFAELKEILNITLKQDAVPKIRP